MQCPLASYCCMSPESVFLGIGCLGLVLGILSVVRPKQSIGLYQWIMKCFNWKVAPIDEPREVRNTRVLGVVLVVLSLVIFFMAFSRF
ncbi:MAG: hypothetical protein WC484_02645 [Candidatus Omnitrophota bacterium]